MKSTMFRAAVALAAIAASARRLRHFADRAGQADAAAAEELPARPDLAAAELNGKPVSADLDVSLKIDGALRGSGYTGCNSWSATMYPVKDQHLAVGPFALTKKQCDKETMAIELGFLSALLQLPTWDLVNGELVIKGPRGSLRLARSL